MTDLTVRTLNALAKNISQDTVAALRGKLRGVVALPGEDGYDAAGPRQEAAWRQSAAIGRTGSKSGAAQQCWPASARPVPRIRATAAADMPHIRLTETR